MINLILIIFAYIVFTVIGTIDIYLFVEIYNNGKDQLIKNNKINVLSKVINWRKGLIISHIDNYMKQDGWIKYNGKKESIIFLNIIIHVIMEVAVQIFFFFFLYVNMVQ